MFRKLVANLAFNPSLLTQVGFYADRIHGEKSLRRIGFVFIIFTMIVQMFAVISPPERSLASSSNHIINGLRTKQDILTQYRNDTDGVRQIYQYYGITIEDLESLSDTASATVRTNDGNNWQSIGRNSLTGYSNVKDIYKQQQIAIRYSGAATPATDDDRYVYQRALKAWDIRNPYNTYQAFKGTRAATGQEFWILLDCGNLTWKDKWATPPPSAPTATPIPAPPVEEPKPNLEIRKSTSSIPTTLKPGDEYIYRIEYRNPVIGTLAEDVNIEDQFDLQKFDVIAPKNLVISPTGYMQQPVGSLTGSTSFQMLEITVRLKSQLPSPTTVCNRASLTASNVGRTQSNEVCVGVITICPYDPAIPDVNNPNCVEPKAVCSLLTTVLDRSTRTATFRSVFTSSNPSLVSVRSYEYQFGDENSFTATTNAIENTTSHIYEPGEYKASVVITYTTPNTTNSTPKQASCQTELSFDKDQILGESKTVKNITKNLSGQEATTASLQSGDVLEYTLYTLNSQDFERKNIDIADYVGDILEYADLDLTSLQAAGGTYDQITQKVRWDDVAIPAQTKHASVFRVTLKNPIPKTNSPSTVGTSYDCKISNVYGNEIGLSVQCPMVKGIESLPNTGPGSSMVMGMIATTIIGYMFARSSLLSKEIDIIRTDYITTGGA